MSVAELAGSDSVADTVKLAGLDTVDELLRLAAEAPPLGPFREPNQDGTFPDFPMPPPDLLSYSLAGDQNSSVGIWSALCERMLTDIHRNHSLSAEEREAGLKQITLSIPGPGDRELHLVEDPSGVFSVGATGAVLWPAAVALIERLDVEALEGTRVIELGAGLGAAGLFLHAHKSCEVLMTETPGALPLLARNIREHCGDAVARPDVLNLRWGSPSHIREAMRNGAWPLVVGSDVTYQPESLRELLTTVAELLAPGGRAIFTMQDRPGEAPRFDEAISRAGFFHVAKREERPMPHTGVKDGSALETGADRWIPVSTSIENVVTYELEKLEQTPRLIFEPEHRAAAPTSLAQARAATTAQSWSDDVEAEFERLTGVKPTPVVGLSEAFASIPIPEVASGVVPRRKGKVDEHGNSVSLKDGIINEYLDRGLGDILCDLDEDLTKKLQAMSPEDRPKSDQQKTRFAEAHYRAVRGEAGSATMPPAVTDDGQAEHVGDASIADDFAVSAPSSECAVPVVLVGNACDARERLCMDGIEWRASTDEALKVLTAVVSFSEGLWRILQGSDAGSVAFRNAVSFELGDDELRVMYTETIVLELKFPELLRPADASAKISSSRRRVTVSVPFQRI